MDTKTPLFMDLYIAGASIEDMAKFLDLSEATIYRMVEMYDWLLTHWHWKTREDYKREQNAKKQRKIGGEGGRTFTC